MIQKKVLNGGKLAGGNPEQGRVEHDYYATNPKAVTMLLEKYEFHGQRILEPCVGEGHIAKTFNGFYGNTRNITRLDIVDRGYSNTVVQDFLTWKTDKKFEGIITNPPYVSGCELRDRGVSQACFRIGENKSFWYRDGTDMREKDNVIAWQPLPESYKGEIKDFKLE